MAEIATARRAASVEWRRCPSFEAFLYDPSERIAAAERIVEEGVAAERGQRAGVGG